MAEKHLVCQGAVCKCKYGTAPDNLKVLTHTKEYLNDPDGTQKLAVSTKDTGATFEKNTFGSCSKQNNRACKAIVSEWKGFYPKIKLTHGGHVLLEDSKGTCPVGGPDCIEIISHGQTSQLSQQHIDNADKGVMAQLYPFGTLQKEDTNQMIPIKQ
jgi:hypothetical protein